MKRQLVLLSGDHEWVRSTVNDYLTSFDVHRCSWVKEKAPCILGQEFDALVLDAYEGLNPDLLGQAIGALRGGGVFFILAPIDSQWPANPDPFHEKIQAANSAPIQYSRFIQRFSRLLNDCPDVVRVQQGSPLPVIQLVSKNHTFNGTPNTEQQCAIDAVKHVVSGHRRRPVVLISDRGRGKSTAFGIAAAQLIHSGLKSIIVTGPSAGSVHSLFSHAALELQNCEHSEVIIRCGDAEIRYLAPDILLRSDYEPELVLVDEAAALPAEILQQLLDRFPRIAFATTVHGYEGTGQGFTLRFSSYLDKHTRGWRKLQLTEPVRWEKDDQLEQLMFDLLLMNAEPRWIDTDVSSISPESGEIRIITQDELVANEILLKELFGLLVLAHYRTRPFDLRYLLDANDLTVYAMIFDGAIVGVTLVNLEGGLDENIAQAITEGVSRPHGHLLPEILASHCGLTDAALMKCARVMRIAIHPALQQQGLGSALLKYVVQHQRSASTDYMGCSFGATAGLLRFWKKLGFNAMKVGIHRGAASGEHSVAMIKGISKQSYRLVQAGQVQFDSQFTYELTGSYKYLDPILVREVIKETNVNALQSITPQDWLNIQSFWAHNRMYETCSASLSRLALYGLSHSPINDRLAEEDVIIVVSRILQQRSWSDVAEMTGLSGRKDILKSLQMSIEKIVNFHSLGKP